MVQLPLRFLARILLVFLGALTVAAGADSTPPLRVMTYNIHHGEGIDGKLDLERIARLITDARADLVALQEVDRGVERTARRDLPAELAKLTGLSVAFERNINHQGGEYGNAVLSRFPIKRVKNTHYRMLRPGEQRGVLQVVVDVRRREVLFLCTHLDFRPGDAERLSNAAELRAIVRAAAGMPVILGGDFNVVPGSPTHEAIKAFLADAWELAGKGGGFTSSAAKPSRRIDYLFVTPQSVTPVNIEVLRSPASDHLPVVAELRLK